MATAPLELLREWGVTGVQSAARSAFGTMNETWIVRLDDRRVVFRRHRRLDRQFVDFEHEVIGVAQARGVPVPEVLELTRGGRVLEHDGALHSLYSHVSGRHVDAASLTADQAAAAGRTLAQIHIALADHGDSPVGEDEGGDVAAALRRIPGLIAAIGECPDQEARRGTVASLEARTTWLEDHVHHTPPGPDDAQLIHGDYQLTNVLFSGDAVAGVIDWDKARVASAAVEVIRAMHHGLDLRLGPCRAFLASYRSERSMPRPLLDGAARWFEMQQAASLWALEEFYVRGNDRVRPSAESSAFVPFMERWSERDAVT